MATESQVPVLGRLASLRCHATLEDKLRQGLRFLVVSFVKYDWLYFNVLKKHYRNVVTR